MSTVLITGVTDGIGLALARVYVAAGGRVLGVGRRDPDSLPPSLLAGIVYCQADLAQPDAAQIVARFVSEQAADGVDILIHNAAVGWYGPVAQQSPDSINELLAVNLYAPIALTHALLLHLRARRGLVVFVSSVHAVLPTPDFAVYTATKAALDGFARSLRIEQAGQVEVITLWVGPTRTAMHAKSGVPPGQLRGDRFPTAEQTAARMAAAIARRRSAALVAGNRLLHWFGLHFETWIDGAMASRSGVAGGSSPKNRQCHAVITGAAEGIGRALAQAFTRLGYAVTGVDVNGDLAAQTQAAFEAEGFSIRFLLADLSQPGDMRRLVDDLGSGPPIDLLIHNAGINCVGPFASSVLATQQKVLAVNLAAPLHLTGALLQARQIVPGASLVFVSSLSRLLSYPGAAVYAASKDGLASYARSMSAALAPQQIHVLTVYPGPTRTAHARRYSPDNSREARRMSPETLAAGVARAVQRRQSVLVPGLGNKILAFVGRWLPTLGEAAMRKTLWEKLCEQKQERG